MAIILKKESVEINKMNMSGRSMKYGSVNECMRVRRVRVRWRMRTVSGSGLLK